MTLVTLAVAGAAAADTTLPRVAGAGGGDDWRPRCAARLRQAQADTLPIDPRFRRGKVKVHEAVEFALELPVPKGWRFQPPGYWVAVQQAGPSRAPPTWRTVNQASPGELDSLEEKQVGRLLASVGEKVWLSDEKRNALLRLWLRAADDCLALQGGGR